MFSARNRLLKSKLAAPSWVFPGTIWENCVFLEHKVDEIALLLMETKSCLAYGRHDLPPALADLDIGWHAHLPLDLPWDAGGEAVAGVCLTLMDMIAFLGADRAVLHPPRAGAEAVELLDSFAVAWRKAGRSCRDLLLENTRENDLSSLGPCIARNAFGVCLDLGHMLAHGQSELIAMVTGERPPLWSKDAPPRMAHLNAPGSGLSGEAEAGAHLPLDTLDNVGLALGADLCSILAGDAVIVAEFFDWRYVERSVPIIARWSETR